jgi:hypothetical protein
MDDRIDKFMCELGIGDDMETVLLEAIRRIAALERELAAERVQMRQLFETATRASGRALRLEVELKAAYRELRALEDAYVETNTNPRGGAVVNN